MGCPKIPHICPGGRTTGSDEGIGSGGIQDENNLVPKLHEPGGGGGVYEKTCDEGLLLKLTIG